MSKIEIALVEYSNMMITHESMEIDTKYWPELEGLSNEEVMKYIKENAHDMKPTPANEDWAGSLYDELYEMDVVREKEYNYETDICKA